MLIRFKTSSIKNFLLANLDRPLHWSRRSLTAEHGRPPPFKPGRSGPSPPRPKDPSSPKETVSDKIELIRNIGIIAHIDAGKTTTTERMLYYAGSTAVMGEVHEGDTVTDYMPQERERGITITSAAITLPWKKHKINLIDTPGHVDFTIEVERALSVLDGAVTILDSSAGVQAQTMTVWRQASRYNVPRIFYLNKMDKPQADSAMSIRSIKNRLGVSPLETQLPLGKGRSFTGVVDLVGGTVYQWDNTDTIFKADGADFKMTPLEEFNDSSVKDQALEKRESLINSLTDLDDQFADHVIGSESMTAVTDKAIHGALRQVTITQKGFPLLLGSSYKNIGVQLLLNSVIRYLPSPVERKFDFSAHYGKSFCGLVFKILYDKRLGEITFVRLYSGSVKPGAKVYNLNRGDHVNIGRIFEPFAGDFNEFRNHSVIPAGNIIVVTGLENTITGDTLVESKEAAEKAQRSWLKMNQSESDISSSPLGSIHVPEPVFSCSIEAPSLSKQKAMEDALERMQKEDPTLKVKTDEDSNQMIISGMGELHIDIIKDRLKRECGVEAYLGDLQVSYREAPTLAKAEYNHDFEKIILNQKNSVNIALELVKINLSAARPPLRVVITQDNELGKLRSDHKKYIERGLDSAYHRGPKTTYPVVGIEARLKWFQVSRGTTPAAISAATAECFRHCLARMTPTLMEPVMRLEIMLPSNLVKHVVSDLVGVRRGRMLPITECGDLQVITCDVPLSELINYSTDLRIATSGNAHFTMEFSGYQIVSEAHQAAISSSFRF